MTPRISLIIGVAVTALAFGVPTALGEGRLAGSLEQDGVSFFYANERATIGSGSVSTVVSRPDSHDIVRPATNGYIDASDRALRINTVVPTAYLDAHERSAPPKGSPPSRPKQRARAAIGIGRSSESGSASGSSWPPGCSWRCG